MSNKSFIFTSVVAGLLGGVMVVIVSHTSTNDTKNSEALNKLYAPWRACMVERAVYPEAILSKEVEPLVVAYKSVTKDGTINNREWSVDENLNVVFKRNNEVITGDKQFVLEKAIRDVHATCINAAKKSFDTAAPN